MQSLLVLLFVALLALLAARVWPLIRGGKRSAPTAVPAYLAKGALLAPEERAYLDVLQQVLGENSLIFPKVSLTQLLEFPDGSTEHRIHWARVQRKCVDLLVCDRELTPTLAIRFHPREGRRSKKHGDPVSESLDEANIPLLTVRSAPEYAIEDVTYRIKLALSRTDSELSDEGTITRETEVQETDSVDSCLTGIRRWSSDLWAAARRTG